MGTVVICLLHSSMIAFILLSVFAFSHAHPQHCKQVKKSVWEDVCEPFIEKKCYTNVHQQCHEVPSPDCKAIVDDIKDHKCLHVEDVVCDIDEHVHTKEVHDKYVREHCREEKETVCDVVHDVTVKTDHHMDCIEVKSVECWEEKKVVNEKKCIFSWEFDCPKHHDEHGHKEHKCHKKPLKKCKNIPKTMHEKRCKPKMENICEKLAVVLPHPVKGEKCHPVPTKKCEAETKMVSKPVKKYSYTKQCKPVPRELCDKVLKQKLRPVCHEVSGQKCHYKPEKHCNEEKRHHCYKKEKVVFETVCKPKY